MRVITCVPLYAPLPLETGKKKTPATTIRSITPRIFLPNGLPSDKSLKALIPTKTIVIGKITGKSSACRIACILDTKSSKY